MSARVNEIEISKKLNKSIVSKTNFFYNSAQTRFKAAKNELLTEFDTNPITEELQEGSISDTNSILVEDGSLRAGLGIPAGDTPADDLREYLDDNIYMAPKETVRITENRNKVYFSWKVFFPSKTEVFKAKQFKLPWTTRTWVDVIENGVNNLIHFVMAKSQKTAERFAKGGSRSGWGLMKNNVNTGRSFNPKPYVSELIANFAKKFGR